jgi:hypothetical protein
MQILKRLVGWHLGPDGHPAVLARKFSQARNTETKGPALHDFQGIGDMRQRRLADKVQGKVHLLRVNQADSRRGLRLPACKLSAHCWRQRKSDK